MRSFGDAIKPRRFPKCWPIHDGGSGGVLFVGGRVGSLETDAAAASVVVVNVRRRSTLVDKDRRRRSPVHHHHHHHDGLTSTAVA